jgi:glycerophosphoryl diester phosphodiesterase
VNYIAKIVFIAHRGFRVGVDENTFQAFNVAKQLRMDFIELDIHRTADNRLVVMHDDTIDRTMNGTGKIMEMQWAELVNLRTKTHLEPIPLLEDVITQFVPKLNQNQEILPHLMIELKGKNVVELACEFVKNSADATRIVFSSRHLDYLQKAHAILPEIPLCLNISSCKEFTVDDFLRLKSKTDLPLSFTMISQKSTKLNKKFIRKCHDFGVQALVWDFLSPRNPLKKIQTFIKWGIDGILFDSPEIVKKLKATDFNVNV